MNGKIIRVGTILSEVDIRMKSTLDSRYDKENHRFCAYGVLFLPPGTTISRKFGIYELRRENLCHGCEENDAKETACCDAIF